jgi:hypothetical protein
MYKKNGGIKQGENIDGTALNIILPRECPRRYRCQIVLTYQVFIPILEPLQREFLSKKGGIRMKELDARVISSEILTEDIARIFIEAPEIAGIAKPGQFVHIKCGRGVYSLMRRPLSIHQVKGKSLVLLFQIKGEGTTWLARRQPGELVDLIGRGR